jgi:DNA-binding NarL/FixJ family response regulator
MDSAKNTNRNILIVDDHPLNVDSYKSLLSGIESNSNANYLLAYDCEQAYKLLLKTNLNSETIDFAFIDISLPPFEEKKILSGSDLALEIRKLFPLCKIIIISMHKEPLWVNQIYSSITPEGFIAKSDVNYKLFPEAFQSIDSDEIYFSPSIKQAQKVMIQKIINWDNHDSKILQLIEEGTKTINLPKFIPLSLSTIEKRKANIKKQLIMDSGSDKELLDAARNLGFI